MAVLLPFVLIPFCFQIVALGAIGNRLLRWSPLVIMELLLLVGMVRYWLNPPSFDILGWEIYLWMMGSVLLGCVLAWGAYALYGKYISAEK